MSLRRGAKSVIALAVLALAAGCGARLGPMERGLALYDKGYYDAALAAFDEAVRQSPRSAAAYKNRGVARIRTGDTRGAIDDFTRAHELSPNDAEVLFNRGNAYFAAGSFAAAIADFTGAVELRPSFAAAVFNRGIARDQSGDREGARADWQRGAALERDPDVRASMKRRAALLSARPSVTAKSNGVMMPAAPQLPPQPAPQVPPTQPMLQSPPTEPTPQSPAMASVPQAPPTQSGPQAPPTQPTPLAESPTPPAAPPPPRLDARALAKRGLDRELGGDRAGALADLRAALAIETEPGHRVGLQNLIRLLEAPQ